MPDQITPLVQRQTVEEEEEELLQTKEVVGQMPELTPSLAEEIVSMEGGGHRLPASERTFFERRFGYDFGNVRIHNDGQATEIARAVKARAFTIGTDVVFGQGQFHPESNAGRHLLAHELTHVIQQNRKSNKKIDRKDYAAHPEIRRKESGFFDKIFNPPPKLIANPSVPANGYCGKLLWETGWELSKYGRGGFVIQEVHWNEKLMRYCDRLWTEESNKTYFEAWWVTKNAKFPSNADAVPDTMGRKRPHEADRGRIEIDATARYHDNVLESDLPGDMVRFNPDTNAGSLRSSLRDPNLGGNISKPVPHSIIFEWDCCDGNRRRNRRTRVISRVP